MASSDRWDLTDDHIRKAIALCSGFVDFTAIDTGESLAIDTFGVESA